MLRDQAWVIALCVIVAVGAAVAYTSTKDTKYVASSKLLLQQDDPTQTVFGGAGTYIDPIRQRATNLDLVRSPRLAGRVARRLKLKGPAAAEAYTGISAGAAGDSNIVTISVQKDSPRLASQLADAYAREYVEFRRDLARTRYDQALADVRRQINALKARGAPADQLRALQRQATALQLYTGVRLSDATVVQETNGRAAEITPNWKRNIALAALLGLFIGLLIALLRDRLDDRIKSDEDLAEVLPDTPILATVPLRRRGKAWRHSAAESYHNLRVNLMSANGSAPVSVLVTSGMGRDGKTTTALNLGLALTEEGRAALVVDGDLRRPRVTEMVGTTRGNGLVNVLAGQSQLADATQLHKFNADGNALRLGSGPAVTVRGDVAVLPAGRTTVAPQKLITDQTVERLLTQAREEARPTVVDGPPIGLFGDMLPVARQVDAVVLVVRLYHTRRRSILTLRRQLEAGGVKPYGVVLLGGTNREQTYYGA
jgi:Mrp family chromosome partitioning ATPase